MKTTGRRSKLSKLVKYAFIALGVLALVVGVWAIHTYRYKGVVEHISFQSGEVTMNGLFIKPAGPGPHPTVVLLHGSGPLPGDGPPVRIMANAFLKSGIATLAYDKRGVGSSGGTFRRNAYGDFIDDGISAVRYLESRNDVDHDAIGLLGSSEGSLIAPEIAVRSGTVTFVIHRSGAAVHGIETSLWETRHELMRAGITGELLEFVMAVDEYKKINERPFPSWTEVFEIVQYLGYRKVAERAEHINTASGQVVLESIAGGVGEDD